MKTLIQEPPCGLEFYTGIRLGHVQLVHQQNVRFRTAGFKTSETSSLKKRSGFQNVWLKNVRFQKEFIKIKTRRLKLLSLWTFFKSDVRKPDIVKQDVLETGRMGNSMFETGLYESGRFVGVPYNYRPRIILLRCHGTICGKIRYLSHVDLQFFVLFFK
jgi:hypothetical protein